MGNFSETKKLIAVLVAGVLLGGALASLGFALADRSKVIGGTGGSETLSQDNQEGTVRGVVVATEDAISVNDQAPGLSVHIATVALAGDGWVVVRETQDGVPTNILGAARFDAGASSGFVELLRGTQSTQLYYAQLHSDNGDRAFNPDTDPLIVDSSGKPVQDFFVTTL